MTNLELILLTVVVVITTMLIICFFGGKRKKTNKEEADLFSSFDLIRQQVSEKRAEIEELKAQRNMVENELIELNGQLSLQREKDLQCSAQLQEKTKKVKELTEQLNELDSKMKHFRFEKESLTKLIAEEKLKEKDIKSRNDTYAKNVAALDKKIGQNEERISNLTKTIQEMAAQKLMIEAQLVEVKKEKEAVEKIVKDKKLLEEELEVLKNTNKEAILRRNQKRMDENKISRHCLELDMERWKGFLDLVEELKRTYPELREDFAQIEWKKVYMPAFQKMIKVLEADDAGVYKISVIGDEDVCYVGKAQTSIKERWYNHAKKMLGVESKGGEWLYNKGLRPENLMWEVIEKGKENLDERERYWIEFYGCLEVGLNRK